MAIAPALRLREKILESEMESEMESEQSFRTVEVTAKTHCQNRWLAVHEAYRVNVSRYLPSGGQRRRIVFFYSRLLEIPIHRWNSVLGIQGWNKRARLITPASPQFFFYKATEHDAIPLLPLVDANRQSTSDTSISRVCLFNSFRFKIKVSSRKFMKGIQRLVITRRMDMLYRFIPLLTFGPSISIYITVSVLNDPSR